MEFGKEGSVVATFLKIGGCLVLGRAEEETWKGTWFFSLLCLF